MTKRLLCRIFGHNFVDNYYDSNYGLDCHSPVNWCVKCGFTKEDLK